MTTINLDMNTTTHSGGFPDMSLKLVQPTRRTLRKKKQPGESLSQIKKRFAANHEHMLERARLNSLKLTGKDRL